MDISQLLIFTWSLYIYILDHLFTPTGGMKNCLCTFMAYLTSIILGAYCLSLKDILVHACFILLSIYFLFVG
jgi:hypothetical protein